jgi:MoCo/4Fe-4S cofactor protein with predicted Tat translocation signal
MKKIKKNFNGEKITYWRSIDSRRRTEEYLASIENEFAEDLTELSSMDRRSMLKVMGASVALAGMGVACRRPEEKILPYVKSPENFVAGIPKFYATAQPTPFGAHGILVESHEGRPTKIEGNPSHPDSLGKASTINQAAILELYDPDRARFCTKMQSGGRIPVEWTEWDSFAREHFLDLKKELGKGLAFLCDADISPSFLRLKQEIKAAYPAAKFFVHEPMRQRNCEAAAKLTFGAKSRVRYHLGNAKIILSLFGDPFSFSPEQLKHLAGFSKNRTVHSVNDIASMNRLYAVEADYSLAGTNADHRLRLPLGLSAAFVRALAYELHASHGIDIDKTIPGAKSLSELVNKPSTLKGIDKKFLFALAQDLAQNKGKALIMGGNHLPKEVLALIHVLNLALGGQGKVFDVIEINDDAMLEHLDEPDLTLLAENIKTGAVNTLVILNSNPVYTAPKALKFKELLNNVATTIHFGLYVDETGEHCSWQLPKTHFLENFSDTRSYDGSYSIIQPLIEPLFGARSRIMLLSQILGLDSKPLEIVKASFQKYFNGADSDKRFNRALHDGIVNSSQFPITERLKLDCAEIFSAFATLSSQIPSKDAFELIISFDRKLLDGRYANHGWLLEMPDPITKMNWDNAVLMSPKAAKDLGIQSGTQKNAYVADVVALTVGDKKALLPVFVMPGLNDYSVTTTLGYGRQRAGLLGNGVGVDNYPLLDSFDNMVFHGVKIERTNETRKLCTTQEQFAMNGDVVQEVNVLSMQNRDPARLMTVDEYARDPKIAQDRGLLANLIVEEKGSEKKVPLQITKAWDYSTGNQWGMVIDLSKCTGCQACTIACQSENNIPVVGKEQAIRGRMMQWIRVDRYFVGDVHAPKAIAQPVLCQHCENAPCEPVCPVAATSHDKEGLNVMTYNRCVGTRYCANNCPYKVRRFNYFDFTKTGNLYVPEKDRERQKTLKLQRNPDVTVRYRGVMEKCTYCTQRIQEAKMAARRDGKDQNNLKDGVVTPACAQTCPSEAIVFGSINDEDSRVTALKKLDRNYTMLDVLNVRPRTSYLSKLRNPHPDLVA